MADVSQFQFLDHNIDISATETDWGIPLSPGVRLVQSMVKLSELSGQYPSSFFVKINPPLSPKSNLTVVRGGFQTEVFVSQYQKKKVAVKQLRMIAWRLLEPQQQIVQNVGVQTIDLLMLMRTNKLSGILPGLLGMATISPSQYPTHLWATSGSETAYAHTSVA